MSGTPRMLSVRPIVSYPRRAKAGESYLLTVDLETDDRADWTYEREEYAVYCLLDTLPLFEHRLLGSDALVLHRFGGTYGPARFLLTARGEAGDGAIRVTLVNGWGVPVHVLTLGGIRVERATDDAIPPDPEERRATILPADTEAPVVREEPRISPDRGPEPRRVTVKPAGDQPETPLFFVPFDGDGECSEPPVRAALVHATRGDYTDVLLLVHGWNTDRRSAEELCDHFYRGFLTQKSQVKGRNGAFRPLLAGLLWESAAFDFLDELGGGVAAPDPALSAEDQREIRQIAGELSAKDADRFSRLAESREVVNRAEGLELARILVPLYRHPEIEDPQAEKPTSEELLQAWVERRRRGLSDFPGLGGLETGKPADPFTPSSLMPSIRTVLRMTTFWQMRERAGRVGARGVGRLLHDLLEANSQARLHLVGHSFGCRVLLSALCEDKPPRRVESLLLLQAAVSSYCFARDLTGRGRPGEFRDALDQVRQPILTTFSARDLALRQFYHLAAMLIDRNVPLSPDVVIEGPGGRHVALGGYGPLGCADECETIPMLMPTVRYTLDGPESRRILALDGEEHIRTHSDISNEATWWALHNLVDQRAT